MDLEYSLKGYVLDVSVSACDATGQLWDLWKMGSSGRHDLEGYIGTPVSLHLILGHHKMNRSLSPHAPISRKAPGSLCDVS